MTYEEAIAIFRKDIKIFDANIDRFPKMREASEQFEIAIEAIQKQIKYRWHDLRKNPEDLPNVGSLVLTLHLIRGKKCFTVCGYMVDGFCDGINPEELLKKTVVAWRYIESCEEDEDGQD